MIGYFIILIVAAILIKWAFKKGREYGFLEGKVAEIEEIEKGRQVK